MNPILILSTSKTVKYLWNRSCPNTQFTISGPSDGVSRAWILSLKVPVVSFFDRVSLGPRERVNYLPVSIDSKTLILKCGKSEQSGFTHATKY